jgi:hypothetical protein
MKSKTGKRAAVTEWILTNPRLPWEPVEDYIIRGAAATGASRRTVKQSYRSIFDDVCRIYRSTGSGWRLMAAALFIRLGDAITGNSVADNAYIVSVSARTGISLSLVVDGYEYAQIMGGLKCI